MNSKLITKNNEKEVVRHIYFVKNGSPHSNKSNKVWKKVESLLKQQAFSYSIYETEYAGHATVLTKEILQMTQSDTIIVAVGGDGTVHEVMNGAINYPHAIIVCMPAGSGNDYVRGVQRTSGLEEVVSAILHVKAPSIIDVGQLIYEGNKKHFVNSLGIGFDAAIAKAVNESHWKKRFQMVGLGKFVYLYFFMKMLFTFNTFHMKTKIDGRVRNFEKVWFLVAANQPYFGGGIKVAPNSTVTDGKIQVIIVNNIPSLLFLLVFATVTWGGHLKLKWVESFTCNNIHIQADGEIPIQADGEHIGYSKISAEIIPEAVRVIK
ncbi:diacylglycerol/lipid kinase family protein [Bacillus massiliigorillae]|uniref:diacylglycerol/lipid kinase family protein n=1 Tax=Bacillus massiliigorillae TaxID=1243664 RepID=UPI000399F49E|nr:diacylglycerol kinase family protein [Bacillus massiliigorillae]